MPLKLHQRHEHHVIEYIVYSEACPWRSCWTGASVAVLGVVLVGAVAAANVVVQVRPKRQLAFSFIYSPVGNINTSTEFQCVSPISSRTAFPWSLSLSVFCPLQVSSAAVAVLLLSAAALVAAVAAAALLRVSSGVCTDAPC